MAEKKAMKSLRMNMMYKSKMQKLTCMVAHQSISTVINSLKPTEIFTNINIIARIKWMIVTR